VSGGLRADARRNRAAIVAAAGVVFARAGVIAPIEDVLAEAGVGRGTLYRHFPERLDLVAAVYEEALADYEAFASEWRDNPELVLCLIDRITVRQATMAGFLALLRSAPEGHARIAELTSRLRQLLGKHIPAAHAAGVLPAHMDVEDLLLVLSMMEGIIASLDPEEVPPARSRLLALLQLTPRGPCSRPADPM
jgi:AcrR family transcriptional regulator